jgi:hypothetical protein
MPLGQRFDPEKILEVILYLVERLADPSVERVLALLYQADRRKLQHTLSLVTCDAHVALVSGCVPRETRTLLDALAHARVGVVGPQWIEALQLSNRRLTALRAANLAAIPKASRDALDAAIQSNGDLPMPSLASLCRDRAWQATARGALVALEEIVRTVPNAQERLAELADLYPGDAAESASA